MDMVLNRKDIILNVSDSWNQELITEGDALFDRKIIDKPLLSFIQGNPTKMYVETVLMRARTTKKTVSRRYRCDELGMKRYCEMKITPLNDGKLKIAHSILRVESSIHPIVGNIRKFDNEREQHKRRCAICCKYEYENAWLEIEDYLVIKKMLPENSVFGDVHYDLCPKCKTTY
jgi:hypothetical protein